MTALPELAGEMLTGGRRRPPHLSWRAGTPTPPPLKRTGGDAHPTHDLGAHFAGGRGIMKRSGACVGSSFAGAAASAKLRAAKPMGPDEVKKL